MAKRAHQNAKVLWKMLSHIGLVGVPTTSLRLDFRRQCEESTENVPIIVCVVPVVTIALSLND